MSLRERKQRRAREQIVDAAYELFAERGFAQVTVTDIAERAEVGRTTFFRYFGDKQEVLFADEQHLIEAFAAEPAAVRVAVPAAGSLPAALAQLWELTPVIGELVLGDPDRFAQHERLVRDNVELQDRADRKLRRITDALEHVLRERGTDPELAVTAAQVAVACFRAAQRIAAGDPAVLLPAMRRIADQLI